MGFDYRTLLCLPFGLLLPIALFVFLSVSKKKKPISFDPILMGIGSFFASIAAVAVVFVFANMFLSSLTFSDASSGMTTVGGIIVVMILAVYAVCESFRIHIIIKFIKADEPKKYSSLGFSAGVVIAQNAIVFVALNIFSLFELNIGYALFSGALLLFTGIMYTVLSYANEIMLFDGHKAPAYALSSVYYLFWIAIVTLIAFQTDISLSSILIYVAFAFFFVLSFVLSAVFIFKFKKPLKEGK